MGLDLTVLVLNNRILGYQKHAENVKFGDHTDAVYMSDVDHAAVAEACGMPGHPGAGAGPLGPGPGPGLG